jgi:hypothetical protein
MKSIKLVLFGTVLLISCSSVQSVPTTTTTTTVKPKGTTVAPIDYGNDCKRATYDEVIRLGEAVIVAKDKWEEEQDKSYDIAQEAFFANMSALREWRSYIRTLDIPLVSVEQRNVVDAIQDYVDAMNQYWESDREDLSLNDYLIPLTDAMSDFFSALRDTCLLR